MLTGLRSQRQPGECFRPSKTGRSGYSAELGFGGTQTTCGGAPRLAGSRFPRLRWFLPLSVTKVTIKGIERELICPACKELFTHPLILPCQHNVCHKCVKEILFAFEDAFADGGSESSNQSSPRIKITSSSLDRIDRISRSGMYRNFCVFS